MVCSMVEYIDGFSYSLTMIFLFQSFSTLQCFIFYSCGSSIYGIIRSVLTITYKFILHAVTYILTFKLHKTKIPALNDRKSIVVTVYTTSVLTVLIGITSVTLQEYPNIFGSIFAVCIWIDATVFLGLTFIPKVW